MTPFDIVLLIVIFFFVALGYALGFITTFGALIGLIFGVYLAGLYYLPLANWLNVWLLGNENLAKVMAFVVIFLVVNRLLAWLIGLINKLFRLISWFPFLGGFNRLLGAVLGLVEGILVLGVVIYIMARFPASPSWEEWLLASKLVPWLVSAAEAIVWLLPLAIRKLSALI